MAATTITEYKAMPCTKCGGSGRIACFQHRNGGECFRCGATGNDPVMREVTREMTDSEVIESLAKFGFDYIETSNPDADSEDYLLALFGSEQHQESHKQAMIVARIMLSAI